MKSIIEGDTITRDELDAMNREQLLELAKVNNIKVFSVVPEKLRPVILEVWNSRLHKGDAFRAS